MTKKTIFDNVAREVEIKAQWIASRRTPEEAKREYDIGTGYICALYDASIFDLATYRTAADLLKTALQEAEKRPLSALTTPKTAKQISLIPV